MNANDHRDPLPEEFQSEEDAAEFWDTHSLADYEEHLDIAEVDVAITNRRFEIEVDESTFLRLTALAKEIHRPIKDLVTGILNQGLKPHRQTN